MLNRSIFLTAFFGVLLILFPFSLVAGQPAPDFSNWKCDGDLSEISRTKRLFCFDKEPRAVAENMVVRYSGEVNLTEGDLLVWFIFERNKAVFSIHDGVKVFKIDKYLINFYKTRRNQDGLLEWVWLETRELTSTSFIGDQKVPIADANSPFGKEYLAFMKRMGRDPAKINMPSIKFYK